MTSDLCEVLGMSDEEKAAIFLRQHRDEDRREQLRRDMEESRAAEVEDAMRNMSSWNLVLKFMREHPTGRHFSAIMDKVEPLRTPADPLKHITKMLSQYGDFLGKVEPDFREFAKKTGHPVEVDREVWLEGASPEEIAENKNRMVFLDFQVLKVPVFSGLVSSALRQCILERAPEKVETLVALRGQLPLSYQKVIPEDIEEWPERIVRFHADLDRGLVEGITIAEARDLAVSYGIDRYRVVMKTWLDERVLHKQISKGRRGTRVAYFH